MSLQQRWGHAGRASDHQIPARVERRCRGGSKNVEIVLWWDEIKNVQLHFQYKEISLYTGQCEKHLLRRDIAS
jgi:hypothetical protein